MLDALPFPLEPVCCAAGPGQLLGLIMTLSLIWTPLRSSINSNTQEIQKSSRKNSAKYLLVLYRELLVGRGRPSLCRSVLYIAAPIALPSIIRRNHDFSGVFLTGFTGSGTCGGEFTTFGNNAGATTVCVFLASDGIPASCAWHNGVAVQINTPHNRIHCLVLFLDIIFLLVERP